MSQRWPELITLVINGEHISLRSSVLVLLEVLEQ